MLNHAAELELLNDPQTLLDYQGGSYVVYVGKSMPGTATTANDWQITKITYDVNNNATSVKFANGTSSPQAVWDLRTTYTYA